MKGFWTTLKYFSLNFRCIPNILSRYILVYYGNNQRFTASPYAIVVIVTISKTWSWTWDNLVTTFRPFNLCFLNTRARLDWSLGNFWQVSIEIFQEMPSRSDLNNWYLGSLVMQGLWFHDDNYFRIFEMVLLWFVHEYPNSIEQCTISFDVWTFKNRVTKRCSFESWRFIGKFHRTQIGVKVILKWKKRFFLLCSLDLRSIY